MEFPQPDQDRFAASFDETASADGTASHFISTENLRFDEPDRSVPSSNRIPVVILHPNGIVRLGIHHALSTSHLVVVRGAAANWQQFPHDLNLENIRAGVFGFSPSDEYPFEAQLAELATIARAHPQIRWGVIANSLPSGSHQAIADAGAHGLIEDEFTSERLELVIMGGDAGRRIGLDEQSDAIASDQSPSLVENQPGPIRLASKPMESIPDIPWQRIRICSST